MTDNEELLNPRPLISIIIPCYNAEKYIRHCLDDVMAQKYPSLETIVVNDGSSDSTERIAAEYPVKIISFPKNRGLSAARNAGIEAATGKYIHFMDVDDDINPDFYSNMIKARRDDDPDVICSGMYNTKKLYKCQIFNERAIYKSTSSKMRATWCGRWGYVWRYLFKKDLLIWAKLRFEEGRFIEDLPFTVRALYYAKSIATAPGAIYKHNLTPNSIMRTRDRSHRIRLKRDSRHSRHLIQAFAHERGFMIPATSYSPWRIVYFLRKQYYNIAQIFGV
jgi:CDP-glycerol glycerophosphotransferase